MSLPRETRDEIYAHMLTLNYRIDQVPSGMRRDLSDDRQSRSFTRYPFAQNVRTSLLSPLAIQMPSDRTALLQVNKTIGAEAKEVLYKSSTFVFITNSISPRISAMGLDHIQAKDMRNIEVNVQCWQMDQSARLVSARKLLSYFAGDSFIRNQCVINIRNIWSFDELSKGLPHTVDQLTTFKTVELNFHDLDPRELQTVFPRLEAEVKRLRLETYKHLSTKLSINLGPCVSGYEGDEIYRMRYHPQNFCQSKVIAEKDDLGGSNI